VRFVYLAICSVTLVGYVSTSTMPLAQDTVQITARAAPACGSDGVQKIAFRQASVETIKRGFDSFIIVGGGYGNNIGVVGYTPVTANTYASATATGYGNHATAYGNEERLSRAVSQFTLDRTASD